MKFARYLEETQTPEWKKAYIDYQGLKKCITAIRAAQEQAADGSALLPPHATPVLNTHNIHTHAGHGDSHDPLTLSPSESFTDVEPDADGLSVYGEPDVDLKFGGDMAFHRTPSQQSEEHQHFVQMEPVQHHRTSHTAPPSRGSREASSSKRHHGSGHRSATPKMGFLPRLHKEGIAAAAKYWEPSRNNGKPALRWDLARSIPLKDLVPMLSQVQRAFFEKLDSEHEKVDTFYTEREKEMRARTTTLKAQLQELKDHRKLFHETHGAAHHWLPAVMRRLPVHNAHNHHAHNHHTHNLTSTSARKRHTFAAEHGLGHNNALGLSRRESIIKDSVLVEEFESGTSSPALTLHEHGADTPESSGGASTFGYGTFALKDAPKGWKRVTHNFQQHKPAEERPLRGPVIPKYDAEDYGRAKKNLKKAVLECYRGLEVLENYRTLNLIGFRKALKKFEKWTKIPAQQAYFAEKIEPSAFSSGAIVQGMLSEMEGLYAARFTRGDNKVAKSRLRGLAHQQTHHFSTFRSGLLLGLALPAFVDGLYRSLQPDTLQAIPGREGLLFVYSIFVVPVLFFLLIGVNILVWARSRINYVFIFELDVKTKLDHRQYFEIPALLLSTLCYAFWLSFARVGTAHFSPTLWPMIWLAFVVVILINPLPLLYRESRFWLIRNIFRLLTPGVRRVEFADFWMGDQLCSLLFTLSNLCFVGCAYSKGFDERWSQCVGGHAWGVPFALTALPLLVRLIQSIRRWVDSKLITHLINSAKYGLGIAYFLVYFTWRHEGGGHGALFVVWIIFGTLYGACACSWDLLMDWSVLKPHTEHTLLRPTLLYKGDVPLYYFAIITNILIRFVWVLYIPVHGPSFIWRTFIVGVLEMLRRVQWNFYRLENEHLGNMDQYRVTREVPLPYSFDPTAHESDGDELDHKGFWRWRRKSSRAKKQAVGISSGDGHVTVTERC